jgi:hypothetical protein
MTTHHFTSRRRAPRFFKQEEQSPDIFIFGGESFDFEYCRFGFNEKKEISFADPVDGPFVSANSKFSDYVGVKEDRIITKIEPTDEGIKLHTRRL